uniref:Uncharacterized protein n=1 Tax=Caenorhabditis japonica TaxID=281687 RepID=A0A8R1INK2_CAEJA
MLRTAHHQSFKEAEAVPSVFMNGSTL